MELRNIPDTKARTPRLWTYYTEALDRATSRWQTKAEYRLHREVGSGEYLFFALSELGAEINLPQVVHRLPALKLMRSAAAQHQGLFNDVMSVAKEEPEGLADARERASLPANGLRTQVIAATRSGKALIAVATAPQRAARQ
ncbi:terpene synthase family protein [Streptomyces sp. NPDC056004]|uniref:terpene synthase family protein n=1 Tax=Streptomyces sp. NPDC056004 TaxID=3345677 RepID=UPI0035D68D94